MAQKFNLNARKMYVIVVHAQTLIVPLWCWLHHFSGATKNWKIEDVHKTR
jgi:hypothetical protein